MVISFGFDKGEPRRTPKIFDVRDLSHDTTAPDFQARIAEIIQYAQAHPGEDIAVGCDKGSHRSRVIANAVATKLRTSVFHRDK
jgi:RNase adaptor protein for sRNA GlmZ degradation